MKQIAYLSLGSNIGQREHFLFCAVKRLEETGKIQVVNFSSIYETDPVGYKDQSDFLNMVIEIRTEWSPAQLLNESLMIEKQLGRKREIPFGPRTIDIDVLLYEQKRIHTDHLIVPHPRMHERSFVLIPLAEINGSIFLPNLNVSVQKQIERLGTEGVRMWRQKESPNVYDLFQH